MRKKATQKNKGKRQPGKGKNSPYQEIRESTTNTNKKTKRLIHVSEVWVRAQNKNIKPQTNKPQTHKQTDKKKEKKKKWGEKKKRLKETHHMTLKQQGRGMDQYRHTTKKPRATLVTVSKKLTKQ